MNEGQRRPSRSSRSVMMSWEIGALFLVVGSVAMVLWAVPPQNGGGGAKIKICKAAIGKNGPIAKALKSYEWDMGQLPTTEEGLWVLFQKKGDVADSRYRGPYLEGPFEDLKDPWGSPYEYRHGSDTRSDQGYDLWSRGPDGINEGGKKGSDDIKNWVDK